MKYQSSNIRLIHTSIQQLRPAPCTAVGRHSFVRRRSSPSAIIENRSETAVGSYSRTQDGQRRSCLHRMPTASIVRNMLLGFCFTSPVLSRPALALMRLIAHSESPLLDPERNPVLRAAVKFFVYNQFCAGTNWSEIKATRDTIKSMGYRGVILCLGREIQVVGGQELHNTSDQQASKSPEVEIWRDGNLETLDMCEEGDWVGMKFTGAGSEVAKALLNGADPPTSFTQAMHAICQRAQERGCRLWVDAEQQALQGSIDRWTIDFMRLYNVNGQVVLYNTLQAYLKESRSNLKKQLNLAKAEGWTMAVKLVRGAYISNEKREKIHDTKQQTDDCYNGIVRDLLSGSNLGFAPGEFPKMQLFIAGHNPESIARASDLIRDLSQKGALKVLPDFGQLQGMADETGCRLLQRFEDEKDHAGGSTIIPSVYKCLTWGSVRECMQYLYRRVVENAGSEERMRDGLAAYAGELRRRLFRQN